MYDWECPNCGAEEMLIVHFNEADIPPNTGTNCPATGDVHKWKRVIKRAPAVKAGPNWGPGGKGYW